MKLYRNLKIAMLVLAVGPLTTVHAGLVSFDYTGAAQQWIVPDNVTSIDISAWGAQGQSNVGGVEGGFGGYLTGTLAVSSGDISAFGGWNGGGDAGLIGYALALGGGGGGATDIRIGGIDLFDRVLVAAGGGGAGGNRIAGSGRGTGGGGGAGYYGGGGGAAWPSRSITLATGGTQTSGGSGGTSTFSGVGSNNGTAGSVGLGGNGGNEEVSGQGGSGTAQVGGAGGGLVGESGKYVVNWTGQSGAGGSSFLDALSDTSTLAGNRLGNGYLEIEYEALIQVSTPATLALFGLGLTGLVLTRRKRAL
jgi:hypothetical protein